MKANTKALHRCLALLLCIVMVAALMPELEASAALQAPVFSLAKSGSSIKISWKPVTGAVNYRVFKKGPSDSSWKKLGDTTGTSMLDKNVANAKTYTYTVRTVSKDGKTYQGPHNPEQSLTFWKLSEPANTKVTSVEKGLKITWSAVSGSPKYRIFRKTTGSWVKVADVTGTSYTDVSVTAGVEYTYAVRCLQADAKAYLSMYKNPAKGTYAPTFQITELNPTHTSTGDGIQIKWSAVPGITDFKVQRYTGQDWRTVADVSGVTSHVDYGDPPDFHFGMDGSGGGTVYTYRVAYKTNEETKITPTKSTPYYDVPELKEVTVDNNHFTVHWKTVTGITQYQILRKKPSDSKFQNIAVATANGATGSYTDTSVVAGQKYLYTVYCIANGKKVSGYDINGIIADYIGTPTLISTAVENDGIHFKFNKVGNVTKYQIYRKTDNTNWAKYKTPITASDEVIEYVDTAVTSGVVYYYSVACSDGSVDISDYNTTGLRCEKLANPKLKEISIEYDGIKITWQGVDHATRYRVFRKEEHGTVWSKLGDTTGLTWTDKTALNRGTYVYTVRCLTADSKSYASGFDETGLKSVFIKPVTGIKTSIVGRVGTSETGKIKVTWSLVEGVNTYNVYRKVPGGTVVKVGNGVSGTSLEDTPPVSGKEYQYVVRAVYSGKMSAYNSWTSAGVFLMAPDQYSRTIKPGAITIRWKYVDGATGYKIYRMAAPNGAWTVVATITDGATLVYKDTKNLVKGQQYIYAVRATRGSVMGGYRYPLPYFTVTAQ